jgi:glutaconate CoA-transferase subunit B
VNRLGQNAIEFTTDEMMAVAMARQVKDRYVIGMGIYAPLVNVALLLAKKTHAPNLYINAVASFAGDCNPYPSLSLDEFNSFRTSAYLLDTKVIYDMVMGSKYDMVYHGAVQVDKYGNYNLTYIMDAKQPRETWDYSKPKLRVVGGAGTPDVTTNKVPGPHLFLARQDKRNLVDRVHWIDGVGFIDGKGSREKLGMPTISVPKMLITNLAMFDFDSDQGIMRLVSVHPNVTVDQVKENMGFEPIIPDNVPVTEPPTEKEIMLLRDEVDPLGVRRLDFVAADQRDTLLKEILDKELQIRNGFY